MSEDQFLAKKIGQFLDEIRVKLPKNFSLSREKAISNKVLRILRYRTSRNAGQLEQLPQTEAANEGIEQVETRANWNEQVTDLIGVAGIEQVETWANWNKAQISKISRRL